MTIKAISESTPDRVYSDSVAVSKASWKKVTLLTPASRGYEGNGPQTLNDGLYGTALSKRDNWLGFNSENMVAVFDLGSPEQISSVGVRNLIETGSWIFDDRGIKVEVSENGTSWQQVAAEQYPSLTGETSKIVTHTLNFNPVTAQYVKLTLDIEKSIPEWHGGKGKPGFIFVDEVMIN